MNRVLLLAALLVSSPSLAAKGAGVTITQLPTAYSIGASGEVSDQPWWLSFDEESLTAVMEEGLTANYDLQVANDRVLQAAAVPLGTLSPILPRLTIDSNISVAPTDTLGFQFGGIGGGGQPADMPDLFYNASALLNGSLELDLFGKTIVSYQAARNDLLAGKADRDGVILNLANLIASAWFDVVLQQQRLEVLQSQITTNERVLEVVDLRFERGEASGVEVLQQRQQLQATLALVPQTKALLATAEQRLAVLLGRAPTQTVQGIPSSLPELPAPPNLGTPNDLLEHRPDLRANQARLDAAWQRRMSSERAFLPTLRATGNAGWQFFDAGEFRETFAWGIGGSLSIPIFNAGQNISTLRQNKAVERQAGGTLSQSMITAMQEVESASAQERQQVDRVLALDAQREAAQQAFEASARRYVDGLIDYLNVLSSLTAKQNAELSLLSAQRDLLSFRLQLHQALGGSWVDAIADRSTGGTP